MSLRPIGWICGELVRKFAGQAQIIQRVFLEIIDEIRDEFPNLLRLTSSNQDGNRTVQQSRSVVARVFYSAHAVMVSSSKSIAKFVQPHLLQKLTDLQRVSHNLLHKLNAPKQPLYKMKVKSMFLYDVISYPTRTALTGVMCISYAALIYLTVSINKALGRIKSIIETEKSSRESSSDGLDADGFPRVREMASESATSSAHEISSELTIKESPSSGSIHTLLSAIDKENEQ
ncbi:spermatogenesis-associated protein 9-like [Lacerta agilis]|uniref:spermatogenesis-associated protein 9-like n=1 Tax=Lacerta agilis TaxID=80427 RepID=UPI001419C571|nr:spermatogenesis-associated protein 9-like [Lacerta agilis]